MKTMYRATTYLDRIEEYEVVKISEKSVWFKSEKGNQITERLSTQYCSWFDSKHEAFGWKEGILLEKVKTSERLLNNSLQNLSDFYATVK